MASPKDLDALSPAEKRALLKQRLERGGAPSPASRPALAPATAPTRRPAHEAPLPSFAQERMWFLHQLQPGAWTYNVPEAVELSGAVDVELLDGALRQLLARHAALRSTFPSSEGRPSLVLQEVPPRVLEREALAPEPDASALQARLSLRLREEAARPFALEQGPLYRFRLFHVTPHRHVLLLVFHHAVFDGWSLNVLMRELGALYAALVRGEEPRLEPLPLEYADFAAWQRSPATEAREAGLLDFWKRQLADAPAMLQLPTDLTRPAVRSDRGAETPWLPLPAELVEAVRAFCREHQVSPFMVFYAAFAALLHRTSQQTDFCVGTPVSGRTHPSLEGLVGLFVNTLALRSRMDASTSFSALLAQVRTTTLEAIAHQEVPFDRLVNALGVERDLSRTPLFQVMFDLYRVESSLADALSSLDARRVRIDTRSSQFDLSLTVVESARGFELFVRYSEDLFTAASAERMRGHYLQLLTHALREPHTRLDSLRLLPEHERQGVLHFARPKVRDWSLDTCLHERLAEHARRDPHRVMLAFRGGQWTYGELEAHTNRAARRLVAQGVGSEQLVALLSPRSEGLIRALLSIHKAGGAYVPLDSRQLPAARVAQLLAESRAPFVLPLGDAGSLLSEALALLPEAQRPQVLSLEGLEAESPEPLPRRALPDSLAYVVFTSGSTGTPKGVMVDHRSVLNHALWLQEDLELTPEDRLSQTAPMGFDISVWQMVGPLSFGGSTYVFDDEVVREPLRLVAEQVEAGVTVSQSVPPVFQTLLEQLGEPGAPTYRRLRWMLVGGQAMPTALCRAWFERYPHVPLVHAYGPAECTDTATHLYMRAAPAGTFASIGTPKANLEVYVLDEALQPVPVGVVGELFIGGTGVSRGYLHHPEWTAERFVPHPLSTRPGARLYRTGDLGRLRPDGLLEFVNRADFQVKVRGMRIELAEVEAALQALPQVRQAAVNVRELRPGDKALVAWVSSAQPGVSASSLQQALARVLPAYMVPSRLMLLEALPLNANGKVDRKALDTLPLDSAESGQAAGEPPRGPVEELLARLFGQVLGVDTVLREDNFFHLGGHSLSATRLVARVRQAFGAELPLATFFAAPSIAGLARELARLQGSATDSIPAPTPRPAGTPPLLSFAQERLWFIQQLQPDSRAYHLPDAVELTGPLDTAALESALRWLLERYPGLRLAVPSREGQPTPVVLPVPSQVLTLQELPHEAATAERLDTWLRDEVHRPFSLDSGPLYRFRLLRLAPERHVLLLTFHHLLLDGLSLGLLRQELGEAWRAFAQGQQPSLPPVPVHQADVAVWERTEPVRAREEAQLAYWKRQLEGAPHLLQLPTDLPRPTVLSHRGGFSGYHPLPPALAQALQDFCRQHHVTPFMVLYATFATLLSRYSGQEELCVGTPASGRTHPATEDVVGFLVNTLVLRTRLEPGDSFASLLSQVRTTTLQALAHQDVPFERLVSALDVDRGPSHSPLIQVMFDLSRFEHSLASALPGLRGQALRPEATHSPFELSLSVVESPSGYELFLQYSTDLFEAGTAQRLVGHYLRLLGNALAAPTSSLGALSLLSPAEREQVLSTFNDTERPFDAEATVVSLFEAQVARTPDAPAVVAPEGTLTFRELSTQASRLAAHLVAQGARPESVVGLCLERSLDAVVSLLAIFMSGAGCLPLEASHPAARRAALLRQARARLVVSRPTLFSGVTLDVPLVSPDVRAREPAPPAAPVPARAEHLAYLLYTSGSTGEPKGVELTHRNVVHCFAAFDPYYETQPGECWASSGSLSFDIHLEELLFSLTRGARTVLREVGPLGLGRDILRHGVTHIVITPSSLATALEEPGALEALRSLKVLVTGGEVLPDPLVRQLALTRTQLVNTYGPTETSINVVAGRMRPDAPVRLGRPLDRCRIYVLDAQGEPVPVGVPGELYIGGTPLGRGYRDRPELTAERFVPDAFSGVPGARLYRTGDRVRWNADGTLSFLGRTDFQVKVRGVRIELEEVEAALLRQPGVRQAAVVVRGSQKEARLEAFLVLEADAARRVSHLREALATSLPEAMVPSRFVTLPALPFTTSGKVDRKALAALPVEEAEPAPAGEPPRGPVEELLAQLFRQVLGVEQVHREEDFFSLGGHSLSATRLVARVRQLFGNELPLSAFFSAPSVAGLASALARLQAGTTPEVPAPTPRPAGSPPLLSFAQERLWFVQQLHPDSSAHHIPEAVELTGPLDTATLEAALRWLLERHPALRLAVPSQEGQPHPLLQPLPPRVLSVESLEGAGTPRSLEQWLRDEVHRPFSLDAGPLYRFRLLRLAPERHLLLLVFHHMLVDGLSLDILVRELGEAFGALSQGSQPSLAPVRLDASDIAAWQRTEPMRAREEAQLEYWKRQLAGVPSLLQLPTDRPRPAVLSHQGGFTGKRRLPPSVSHALQDFCRQHHVTPFMVLFTTFSALLHRYSRQTDFCIGAPVSGRSHPATEDVVGLLLNNLALRTRVTPGATFASLLAQVRTTTLEAVAHQDVPFERLVHALGVERSPSQSPLVQVMFYLDQVQHALTNAFPGLRGAPVKLDSESSAFDFALGVHEGPDGYSLAIRYSTDLFDDGTPQRLLTHYLELLSHALREPDTRVDSLRLLSEEELGDLRHTARPLSRDYSLDRLPYEYLSEHALREPKRVALAFPGGQWSYGELAAHTHRAARKLVAQGVGPERIVGVLGPRTEAVVRALLSIHAAGGAYMPLDSRQLPAARVAQLLAESRAPFVLPLGGTDTLLSEALALLPEAQRPQVLSLEGLEAESPEPLPRRASPDNLAYVLFTSGSTGTPKGVMVEHRSLLNHHLGKELILDLRPGERLAQTSAMSFDISIWQMLGALPGGGATYVFDDEVAGDPLRLLAGLAEADITLIETVPAFFQLLVEQLEDPATPRPRALRTLVVGGQALPSALCRAWFKHCPDVRVLNAYGPAECTDTVAGFRMDTAPESTFAPIGRPKVNQEVWVLDEALQLVPVGVVGELYLGGQGVSRGYLHRPELTAERFVPHPFSQEPGARLYRSGDLGRLRPDGLLEFVDRTDFQVKVRGMRIELGEVDAALQSLPQVRQAATTVHEVRPGDKSLVAWVVPSGPGVSASELPRALARVLPAYMVPSRFMLLEALPLNANGKVDRKALQALPLESSAEEQAGEPPRGPEEEQLAQLFRDVLGVERVAREDDFFRLGGHSLSATRLVARVRQAFGVELPLSAFFSAPTIAALAAQLATAPRKAPVWKPAGVRPARLPASLVQERLWYALQLPEAPPFVVVNALVLEGALDAEKLEAALEAVVERNETLRTTFSQEGTSLFVRVNARATPVLSRTDLSHLPADERLKAASHLATRHDQQHFDPGTGPLYRFELLRMDAAGTRHVLILSASHLVLDGLGMMVLLGEVATAYQAALAGQSGLPPPALQYTDFALWQRQPEQLRQQDESLESWKQALAHAPPVLDLPLDFPRRAPALNANMQPVRLSLRAEDMAGLKALARRQGVTTFTAALALMQGWLHRLSAQSHVVVASPFSGRVLPQTEQLVGYFANVVPLCTDVSGDLSFRELLARAHGVVAHATAHQEVPFKRIADAVQPEADLTAPPLAQALLLLDTLGSPSFGGLTVSPLEGESIIPAYDVVLHLVELPEGTLSGVLATDSALFSATTAERMARAFEQLLAEAVRTPDVPLSRLPLLSSRQRAQVLAALDGGPQEVPAGACIHSLFEAQVPRTPEAPAVAHGSTTWSYAELNARANLLARHLLAQGLRPEERVGVVMEPSAQGLAVLLGILKAGGAYVPLDPGWPEQRKRTVLERAGVRRLWVDASAMATHYELTPLVEVPPQPAQVPGELGPGPRTVSDTQLAYIIFTSGSTGEPKGVMVEHRSVVNHNLAIVQRFGLRAGDRMLQFAPLSFDAAAEDLYPPLAVGATVVMRSGLVPAHGMTPYLEQEGITVISLPPTYIEEWVREMDAQGQRVPARLHLLAPGGDVLKRETYEAWVRVGGAHAPWVNVYGPTECTITSATCDIPGAEGVGTAPTFPIGRPIPRVRFYLLDDHFEPVVPGLPGKVYIGGVALSRGYLDAPDMTAERFIPDPFAGVPGARMYATGDLARLQPDGRLRFLGRADHQVKIRGFRIELSEIETCLRRHPGVEEAVVMARTAASGVQQLCAWVQAPASVKGEALRAHVAAQLPGYMVPATFVVLEQLPLNNNGKVDRKALPDPEAAPAPVAPEPSKKPEPALRSTLEMALQRLWKEVLQQPEVRAEDNFFDLGGDSILAMRLLGRLEEEFGMPVPLATLFQYPILRETADAMRALFDEGTPRTSVVRLSGEDVPADAPALFFLHSGDGELHHYLPLIQRLGHRVRCFGLQAPETVSSRTFATFDERIAAYVQDLRAMQPHGPYRLLGYSYGGCAAYGVAAALEAAGEEVALLGLLDALTVAEGGPDIRTANPLRVMAEEFGVYDARLEQELASTDRAGQWELVAARARAIGALAPHFDGAQLARVYHVLGEVLVPQVQRWTFPTVRARALLITSAESRERMGETLGWERYMRREQLDVVPVEGSHIGTLHAPQVEAVAQRLRALLGLMEE